MIYEEAKELIKEYLDESETISDFFAKIFPLYEQTMDEDVKLYDPIWDIYIDDFKDDDDDEKEKLKNCPFCGSSKIIVWGKDIMCDDCEARGPARQTIARAKEEWNRRVKPVRYKDCKY